MESTNTLVKEIDAEAEPAPKCRRRTRHTYNSGMRHKSDSTPLNMVLNPLQGISRRCSTTQCQKVQQGDSRKHTKLLWSNKHQVQYTLALFMLITCLQSPEEGHPDELVKEYLKQLRAAGGVINSYVVVAAAKRVVVSKNTEY